MLAGDFERAWCVNDRVRALGAPDPNRLWQGEDPAGKRVIVRCLHGFGDSIQFLRFIARLKQVASSVCVEVAPHFVELARCIDGVDNVITWGAGAPTTPPAWDVQMEVMELPYIFRTVATDLPLAQNYVRLGAFDLETSHLLPGSRFNSPQSLQVGLVWTAGEWNPARGLAFDLLQPLLAVDGCEFWNLRSKPAPCGVGGSLREDPQARGNLIALARRVAQLDLVITVDTLAAHLAGALSIPTWVLLQHDADWRWMAGRDDSPWYPSLQLFRQTADGDWRGVIERITAALRDRITQKESIDTP